MAIGFNLEHTFLKFMQYMKTEHENLHTWLYDLYKKLQNRLQHNSHTSNSDAIQKFTTKPINPI